MFGVCPQVFVFELRKNRKKNTSRLPSPIPFLQNTPLLLSSIKYKAMSTLISWRGTHWNDRTKFPPVDHHSISLFRKRRQWVFPTGRCYVSRWSAETWCSLLVMPGGVETGKWCQWRKNGRQVEKGRYERLAKQTSKDNPVRASDNLLLWTWNLGGKGKGIWWWKRWVCVMDLVSFLLGIKRTDWGRQRAKPTTISCCKFWVHTGRKCEGRLGGPRLC